MYCNISNNNEVTEIEKEICFMIKREQKGKFTFDFDEKGTNEVSEQIMNSYNSGFIGQGDVENLRDEYTGMEG
jgi:hypothetical protein